MQIIIKKPIISEKSMKQAVEGLYTFLVDRKMRKPMIAKEIAEKFAVTVTGVKTINVKGEQKMQRGRRKPRIIAGYKKAMVTLKKGQKITLFEQEKEVEVETAGSIEGEPVKEKKSLLRGTKVKIEKTKKEAK